MNPRSVAGRLAHACLVIVFCAYGLGACGNSDTLEWTEEVRLHDGRILVLKRYQEFMGPHEIGDAPSESDYWFEFQHPDTGETIRWESDRDLGTLVLMVDSKSSWLLTTPRFGGWDRKNNPRPPYLLFQYEAGRWHARAIQDIPVKEVVLNVTYSAKDARDKIIESNFHLSIHQTYAAPFRGRSAYVIDFRNVPQQTFGLDSVGKPVDFLIKDRVGVN